MNFFKIAKNYTEKIDVVDLALLKFCLFSGGIIVGSNIPKKQSMVVSKFSFFIFLATYCALMTKFVSRLISDKEI